jgi:hypothetical protein
MDNDIQKRFEVMESKIDAIYVSVEKTRKYFFWTMVLTLVVFIVPLIGMIFVVPSFLSNYTSTLNGISE